MNDGQFSMNRRRFISYFSAAGLGSTLMPGVLTAVAQDAEIITSEMLEAAQKIAGLSFTRAEQKWILQSLNGEGSPLAAYDILRAARLGNDTQSAIVFNPVPPGKQLPTEQKPLKRQKINVSMPATDEELAFLPVTHIAKLVESRQVKPSELTKLYLARLKQYDPMLHCVVNLTEEIAQRQAKRADEEIAAGTYRGPLHGIPWGVKDLLAVHGTRTTWGASPYKERVINTDATVFRRLTEAGAILLAKLSTGALADGDQWFGGQTRNPWNTDQGSSGSSAGPGSATAAGLVGFSIGTETGGSIMSPAARNGVTGLRPTFGRVSRYGAMALAWTMDKIGPMCRSAEDCALVFNAIYGPDNKDNTLLDVPFNWDATADVTKLRVGYRSAVFENDIVDDPEPPKHSGRLQQIRKNYEEALHIIRSLGVEVIPFELPDVPSEALSLIEWTEKAAAFDAPTRSGKLDMIKEQPDKSHGPADHFRTSRFIPAVEYIQANRLRMRVMEEVDAAMSDFDLFISTVGRGSSVYLTNHTGHPAISMPSGFFQGSPTNLMFTGKLFGEPEILLLAHAFQGMTDHHLKHPQL